MPEFLKGMSYIDLGLIVIGVLALLIGLTGKAPKRIFHMLWVILAIPATYLVNKFAGEQIYNAIMGINIGGGTIADTLKSLTSSVSQYIPADMFDSIVKALLVWVEGIACLIVIPLVGDIIVGIFCIKAKKHTAWKTLGIPKLISTAVVWTYLLLPLILLTPMMNQVPGIVKAVTESGILDKMAASEEVEQEGSKVQAVSVKSGNTEVLAAIPDLNSLFAEDGIGTLVLNQFTKSYYLKFTSEKVVPVCETTLSKIEKKTVKFLSYVPAGATEPVGILSSLAETLESLSSLLESPLMDMVSGLMSGEGEVKPEEIAGSLLSMSKDEAKELLQNVSDIFDPNTVIGGALSGVTQSLPEEVKGLVTNLSEEDINATAALIGAVKVTENADGSQSFDIDETIVSNPEKTEEFIKDIAGSDLIETVWGMAGAAVEVPASVETSIDSLISEAESPEDIQKYQDLKDLLFPQQQTPNPEE